MRLTDLEPRWLELDGRRVGFMFKSPTDAKFWQTCFFQALPLFGSGDALASEQNDWLSPRSQMGIIKASGFDGPMHNVQGCNKTCAWACAPDPQTASFETISVTPSLDGSPGGLWHGFITDGEIR